MKKYGESYKLTQDDIDVIATYMDDDIREELHGNPDYFTPEDFLMDMLNLIQILSIFVKTEFDIELEEE